MYKPMEEALTDWLTDSLNVLVCTKSSHITTSILSTIGKYPAFKIHRASTESTLNMYLKQNTIWNCIIIDNDISFAADFIDNIKLLSKWVPVVLLENSNTNGTLEDWCVDEVGLNKYNYLNAKNKSRGCIIEICEKNSVNELLSILLSNSLKKLFFTNVPDNDLNVLINVLYKKNPISVMEWAQYLDITPRKMQRLLKCYTTMTPKKMICIYHAFRMVLALTDKKGNLHCKIFTSHSLNESNRKRFLEYVLSRRSNLLKVHK